MSHSLEVILVSSSPIFAEPLRQWLESGPEPCTCRMLTEADPTVPATLDASAVVLIVPQHWREMARWLPCLRREFSGHPWLFLADLRLAGMFWPYLEAEDYALVPPGSPCDELRVALRTLTSRDTFCHPSRLMELFAERAPALPDSARPAFTTREIQCGCAISLGLANQQIAELLHLGMSTLKGHIGHLMRKLATTDRDDVARYFERALGPSSSTSGMGK